MAFVRSCCLLWQAARQPGSQTLVGLWSILGDAHKGEFLCVSLRDQGVCVCVFMIPRVCVRCGAERCSVLE